MATQASDRFALKILPGALLLALGALPGSAFATKTAQAASSVCTQETYACWMGDTAGVIGQRPLTQVIMPGSHDSGTYGFPVSSYQQTQVIDIFQQLLKGARALDIRAQVRTDTSGSHSGPRLVIYHGDYNSETLLSDVLGQIKRFTTDPGAEKEILYLVILTPTASNNNLVKAQCEAFAHDFGAIALTPQQAIDTHGFRSLSEIWALPNHPRVIVEWENCRTTSYSDPAVNAFWGQNIWRGGWSRNKPWETYTVNGGAYTNGDYYANQGLAPCIYYADSLALDSRRKQADPNQGVVHIDNATVDGLACPTVPGFQDLGSVVTGLYVLNVQQTGIIPGGPAELGKQARVLSKVQSWFWGAEKNARANLNYVSGDFINDTRFYQFAEEIVGLNQAHNGDPYAGGPLIATALTTDADGLLSSVTATCRTTQGIGLAAGALQVLDHPSAGTSAAGNPAATLTVQATALPASGAIFQCRDDSNRIARLVFDPTHPTTALFCTGATETYTVPAGVTQLTVVGGAGSGADAPSSSAFGGRGSAIQTQLNVTPGELLGVTVGCASPGRSGGYGDGNGGNGGANNGSVSTGGGGGGGSSAIADQTMNRLLVLGGGGGAGGFGGIAGYNGGDGGATADNNAYAGSQGTGAGAGSGGSAGASAGVGGGAGGDAATASSGGGGGGGGGGDPGGNGGGGGGAGAGGGGGGGAGFSSASGAVVTPTFNSNRGDGFFTLTYSAPTVVRVSSSVSAASPYGQAITFSAQVAAPGGTAAGSVSFYDGNPASGGVLIGSPQTPDNSGHASVTTSSLGAGAHTIYAVYTSADGAVTSQGTLSQQITPAPLTITANGSAMTYGGAVPAITPSYSGFVNNEGPGALTTAPTCGTTATSASPAGSYATSCAGAAAANYAISYAGGTLTIATAPLTITASSTSMTYGGAVPAITPSYSGFVNNEGPGALTTAPTCGTTATSASPAGSYATSCAGAAAANYAISYAGGMLTIATASLTITADNQTMTLHGPVPALTVGYQGLVNGDTAASLTTAPTCSTTATSSSPAGSYPITCGGAVNPNYTISYQLGTLTVLYRWSGFSRPINDPAAGATTISMFKAGSTVPVKFQLTDANGVPVQAGSLPTFSVSAPQACSAVTVDESVSTATGDTGTTYRWDGTAQQYIYNYKTANSFSGQCQFIRATLDDGTTQSVYVGYK